MTDTQAKAKWMTAVRPLCVENAGCWCLYHSKNAHAIYTRCALRLISPVVMEKRYPTCKICCNILNGEEISRNELLRRAFGIT